MMDPWTNYWSLCRWRWRRYTRKRILELRAEIFCIKFLLCIECPLCPTMDNNCPSPKSPLHTYLKTFEYESHQLKVQYPNTCRPTSHVMYISPDKAQFFSANVHCTMYIIKIQRTFYKGWVTLGPDSWSFINWEKMCDGRWRWWEILDSASNRWLKPANDILDHFVFKKCD